VCVPGETVSLDKTASHRDFCRSVWNLTLFLSAFNQDIAIRVSDSHWWRDDWYPARLITLHQEHASSILNRNNSIRFFWLKWHHLYTSVDHPALIPDGIVYTSKVTGKLMPPV
jgi:hypothetical protein